MILVATEMYIAKQGFNDMLHTTLLNKGSAAADCVEGPAGHGMHDW